MNLNKLPISFPLKNDNSLCFKLKLEFSMAIGYYNHQSAFRCSQMTFLRRKSEELCVLAKISATERKKFFRNFVLSEKLIAYERKVKVIEQEMLSLAI